VLRGALTRAHRSAISAVTTSGRVLLQVQAAALRGPRVVRLRKHRLPHRPGTLRVIWDGAPLHRRKVVKHLLAEAGAERRWLEQLPSSAPDRTPVEGIWRSLKRVRVRNVCCRTLAAVRYALRLAPANLRHQAQVLASFPTRCGYQL
jgi:transposase